MSRTLHWVGWSVAIVLTVSGCTATEPNGSPAGETPGARASDTPTGKMVKVCHKKGRYFVRREPPINTRIFSRDLAACVEAERDRRRKERRAEQRAANLKREAQRKFVQMLENVPESARALVIIGVFCDDPLNSIGTASHESYTPTPYDISFLGDLYDKYVGDSSVDIPPSILGYSSETTVRGAYHAFCPPRSAG